MAADEIIIETTSQEVIEVGVVGPQGPAGAAGTGLETLTTKGDTLYRGETTGERLPIGSTGQVLKVSAQGVPSWANESGAVTSVNGQIGVVTIGENNLNPPTVSTANLISTTPFTLAAQRNHRYQFLAGAGGVFTLYFPTTGNQVGDLITVALSGQPTTALVMRQLISGGTDLLIGTINRGGLYTARWSGSSWSKYVLTRTLSNPPSAKNSTGTVGEMASDSNYLYVCVADNSWVRVALATNW